MRDRIAAAVLLDNDRVLLCQRSRSRRWYPGVWDLPGGHVEVGEAPATALARELQEELGIVTHPRSARARVASDDYEMDVFVVREWDGTISNNAPDEHDNLAFVTLAEAARLQLADAHLLPLLARTMAHQGGIAPPTTPHVVGSSDADYPWPTPTAHFSMWAARGEPQIDGQWLSVTDQGSPLRERHWWPIANHARTR